MAAITATNLATSGSVSDANSYATASVSPTSGSVVLVAVASSRGSDPATPTVTGASTTWTQIDSQGVNGFVRITLFRGIAAGTGALTIDFSGETQDRCGWSIVELANTRVTGTNGSNAIRQSAKNSAASTTTVTATLSSFGSTENATFGASVVQNSPERTIAAGSGFTEVAEWDASAGEFLSIQTEFRNDNDTTVDITASSTASNLGIIGVELANFNTEPVEGGYIHMSS